LFFYIYVDDCVCLSVRVYSMRMQPARVARRVLRPAERAVLVRRQRVRSSLRRVSARLLRLPELSTVRVQRPRRPLRQFRAMSVVPGQHRRKPLREVMSGFRLSPVYVTLRYINRFDDICCIPANILNLQISKSSLLSMWQP